MPQKVTISSPRLVSEVPPNFATVNAMPPNAPIGAAHMIRRMTRKMIWLATSKTATTFSRCTFGRPETAAATSSASTSTRRISFSTNGETKLVGSRSSVMKPTTPWSPPASPIDSLASAFAEAETSPSKPLPGFTMLPASRPSPSATTVIVKK